ncbi:hypothetical protein RSAG8_08200, partial [Rhizoctonia solani AG-8 WAC10335]
METTAKEGSHPVPVDWGNLTATIALASDALAAAADALAEAARAMADASGPFENASSPKIASGITYPVNVPEGSNYRDEPEINNEFIGLQSQADQHGLTDDQDKPRFEHVVLATSSPPGSVISISSDSSSEVVLVQLDSPLDEQIPGHGGPRHEANVDFPEPRDTPEPELNNKLDALPLPPVVLTSDGSDIVTNQSLAGSASGGPQSIIDVMKSYPTMPPGRNYIHLELESDAFAFMAYMTLQAHRIICLIPDHLMKTCSELLQSLTNGNIYRVHSFKQFQSHSVAFGAISQPISCNVMLVPPIFVNLLASSRISPDCVLHWGQPSSAYRWVQQVLAFINPAVRVCVMVVGEQYFNGIEHGVIPYSNAALATCYEPNSPFQLLRQRASQAPPRPGPPTSMGPLILTPPLNLHPGSSSTPAPITAYDRVASSNTFPVGLPVMNGPRLKELRLLEAMKSHPEIPPGRNYIHLDGPSDALAFIAYMALQAHKIVCVVPSERQDACAKLLKSITHANVLLSKYSVIDTPEQYDNPLTTLGSFNPASYDILLTPCNEFTLNARWVVQQLNPDCILHWSQPANVYFFTTRRLVNSLPRAVRTCVLVVGESAFDGKVHGVESYPSSILDLCFRSGSPFQLLRQISSQLVPASPTVQALPRTQAPKQSSHPRPSEPSNPQSIHPRNTVVPLPTGHYYIILDQASDIDIISMTAYIALNSKKVICFIPSDTDLIMYHNLMNQIANVDAIAPPVLKGKPLKKTLKSFKSQKKGVWLRAISTQWTSFWSQSLVDCAIYWGIPPDLAYYSKECKLKVKTSYLILTPSQYSSIQSQLNAKRGIKQHPHIRASDTTYPGSLLYDLRQRLALLSLRASGIFI